MTEPRLAELFTALSAFRRSLLDRAGALAEGARVARGRGDDDMAELLDEHAREFAASLEALTRIADAAQEDTQTMSIDELAGAS